MNTIQINTKYLINLISLVSIISLTLAFSFFFGTKNLTNDTLELLKQIIPNLLSSLIVFSIVYFFIDRKIDESKIEGQIFSATQSNREDNFSRIDSIPIKKLQEMEDRLFINRQQITQDITKMLNALNQTENTKQREAIESQLSKLYIQSQIIDEKVSIIKDRLSLSQKINDRDGEIIYLKNQISELEKKINSHKMTAQTIMETAKQI